MICSSMFRMPFHCGSPLLGWGEVALISASSCLQAKRNTRLTVVPTFVGNASSKLSEHLIDQSGGLNPAIRPDCYGVRDMLA
jgi:hypothetical protein